MNLNETLDFIHGLYRKGVKPGLHREIQLLEMLGNPHKKLKFAVPPLKTEIKNNEKELELV